MFFRGYNLLTSMARGEALPSPAAAGAAKERAQAAAQLAMSRDLPDMPLSQRLSNPAGYLRLQRGRRQALEALIQAEADGAALERITDLICMLAEETTWSENPKGAPFDDDQHPQIDFQCAETLMLLAWTHRALGERLGSRVCAKLQYEARRRVFSPFLAHADYPFMRFVGPRSARASRPLCILSDILLSAAILESDAGRRGAIFKQALRLLDQAVQAREQSMRPLADELAETAAVTDLCMLLRKLTRGEMDLTEVYPTSDWLDALLFPWLGGEYFADPATADMRPALSGQELFRVGLAANDEALAALGAALYNKNHRPSATVTGRLLDPACAAMLAAQSDTPPRLKHAATPRNRVMLSRLGDVVCALHTGGERANAGNLLLFRGDAPVLVEAPGQASLPLIGGIGQVAAPGESAPEAAFGGEVCPADFQVREDRELMSVELTHAWPARAGARAVQRTVMALRREGAIRVVDAFDLERPAAITFRFITPQEPMRLENSLRLGPMELSWEGALNCQVTTLSARFPTADAKDAPLRCVSLTTPQSVGRGYFSFYLAAAQ